MLTCEEPMRDEQKCKILTNDETKIITTNEKRFKNTIKILEESNIRYYRPQLKSEKGFRVLQSITKNNHDPDQVTIKNELYDLRHKMLNVTNTCIQIKNKINQNNKNSEWTYIKLPLFFVD